MNGQATFQRPIRDCLNGCRGIELQIFDFCLRNQADFRKFVEDGATKARSGSPAGQSSPSATPYQKETQAAQQNNA